MTTTTNKPAITLDEAVRISLQTEEARTTIVHCRLYSPLPTLARIWRTTYLIEEDGRKVSLIKAFKIATAPNWSWIVATDNYISFTLLFEGLSKSCSFFYLFEEINEPGGFYSGKIDRNQTDVYQVELAF